jgi:hypothetical protein
MSSDLLNVPLFNSHPKLQDFIEHTFRSLTSAVNLFVLAVFAIIFGISLYFKNVPFVFWSLAIYGFLLLCVMGYVLYVVFTSENHYSIRKYNLNWNIKDELGNIGDFTLTEEITLRKTTDSISIFLPLDDFVTAVRPFSFMPIYYGYRKRIMAYLLSFKKNGTPLHLTLTGRRNVTRKDGNHYIEIPIDFPTDELNVLINFSKITEIYPELSIRHGGDWIIAKNNKKCSIEGHSTLNGLTSLTCKINNPKFGHSYIISW